jgi:hypothetical protein
MFNGGRNSAGPDNVAVSAVDRTGNESAIVLAEIGNSRILPALTKPKPRQRVEPKAPTKPKAKSRPAKKTGRNKKKG